MERDLLQMGKDLEIEEGGRKAGDIKRINMQFVHAQFPTVNVIMMY